MKRVMCAAVGMMALTAAVAIAADEKDKKPKTAKEVMVEAHKGKPPMCATASKGELTKEQAEHLLSLYVDMAKDTPKKGSADSWKEKCDALVAATKKLVADQKDTADFKKAVNCKACHDVHK
jgi:phage terminase Nu1 subunit (DNA packaging protein)